MVDYSEYGPAYKGFKVEDGVFVPRPDLDFPGDDPFAKVMPVRGGVSKAISFDADYPYLDDSFKFRFNHFACYAGLWSFAFLVNRIRYGLKIEGRRNITRNRRLFRNGAMTVCNHVYRWDMMCVLQAIRFRTSRIPMLSRHFLGKDAWFVRHIGGIPLPDDRSGLRAFDAAFDEIHRRGGWMHVFPESCSWRFYSPIRPFKIGAFNMAYKYDIPVIPCSISFRERKGFFRIFKTDEPLVTIHVGEPLIPDTSKPRKAEAARLRDEAHAAMVSMAGITANPWPSNLD